MGLGELKQVPEDLVERYRGREQAVSDLGQWILFLPLGL